MRINGREPVIERWWSYNRWTLLGPMEWTALELEKAAKIGGRYMDVGLGRGERYEDWGCSLKIFEPPEGLGGTISVWRKEEMMTEYVMVRAREGERGEER